MMTLDEMAAAFGFDLAAKQKPKSDPTAPPPHGWDCEADIAAAWAHFADESNWTFTSDGGVSVYKAACRLRDMGISPDRAAEIISETIPAHPWDNGHIETKVSHAYKYAQNPAGCRSVLTAIDDFNTELGDLDAYLERGFVSIGRLDPAEIPRMRWIIHGFLQCGQITLIAGQGGVGKSLHAWGVAVCVAMGLPFAWWDAPARPRRVLCLSGEDDEDEIARRVAVACKAIGRTGLGDNFIVWRLSDIRLATKNQLTGEVATTELWRLVRAAIRELDVGLLVIDPLVRIGQGFNENDNVDQDLLFQRVQWLVAEQDCAVLIDDHFAKVGSADDQNAVRGASAKVNAARCAVTLTQMKVEDHKRLRPPKPRRNYVLFSMPKTNYSGRPEGDRWLEMTEFEVGNGETRPALIWRDLVAAHEFFDAFAWEHKDKFLDMVAAGRWIASTHGAKETRLDCAMVAAGLASSGKEAVDIIAHFAEEAMIEKTTHATRHRNVATVWTCTGRRERP